MREAPSWMKAHRATQEWIANRLGVCRTTLAKFLADYPECEPLLHRTRMLRLLRELELLFSSRHLINRQPLELPRLDPPDDGYMAAYYHSEGIQQLLEETDPVYALRMIGPYCSQAVHCHPGYRASTSVRTLIAIGGLVSLPSIRGAEESLFAYTVLRIDCLVKVALQSAPEAVRMDIRSTTSQKTKGYSGCGLAYCGVHLDDDSLISKGATRLATAASQPHARHHGHWHNYSRFVDVLLDACHPMGDRLAHDLTASALRAWNNDVQATLCERDYPALRDYWRRESPEMAARLGLKGECA